MEVMIQWFREYYYFHWPDLLGTLSLATAGVLLTRRASIVRFLLVAGVAFILTAVVHWLRFRGAGIDAGLGMAIAGILAVGVTILLLRRFATPVWAQALVGIVVGFVFGPMATMLVIYLHCSTGRDCI